MDTLRALVLILHAKNRRGDPFPVEFAVKRKSSQMTPKFRGLASTLAKLQHDLDADAQKFLDRASSIQERKGPAFKKMHAQLDGVEATINDVETFGNELEASNGGPILDDSHGSSEKKD